MILIECAQGSTEWLQARAGVITASRFSDAIGTLKNGEPNDKSLTYAAQVALERVTGEPCDEGFVTWQMKRGSDLEPKARFEYEIATGLLASESGVVLTDDKVFGYSTDGFVGDTGSLEIKCPASAKVLIAMWRDGDMSDYMHQMQGGMWITGREWCDFVMYAPGLESVGKSVFYRRVPRDDNFIDGMEFKLRLFADRAAQNEKVLRA